MSKDKITDPYEKKKNKLNEVELKFKKETERKAKLERSIEEAKVGREPSEKRIELLKQLKEQQEISKSLTSELKKYKENDPILYETKGNTHRQDNEYCINTKQKKQHV